MGGVAIDVQQQVIVACRDHLARKIDGYTLTELCPADAVGNNVSKFERNFSNNKISTATKEYNIIKESQKEYGRGRGSAAM